ncbi:MAG TPA: thiol reductant ABC exporter subunit CydC, partial [Marmoricola sp.]
PLRRVGAEFHAAAEGTATFERIHELTTAAGPAPLPSTAGAPPGSASGTVAPGPPQIVLTGLTLGYGDAPAVVRHLDATIPGPGLTAIVGPSGCGKSTLLAALVGELTPRGGALLADGRPVDPAAWRRHVAFVPQRPWLTRDTVAANVRIGLPDAHDTSAGAHGGGSDADGAVWQALDAVALREVVAALPDGIETVLGEDGAGLSAGQLARLALARVLVSDRPVVVLDEPTAHLDAETEAVLLETLRALARSRTVVVVAHRRAVVAAADHVIRMDAPAPGARPRAQQPSPIATDTAPPPPAPPEPGEQPVPARWRQLLGPALAVLASASGVALTATAGWLIVRASEHPPVLVLMVAIIGVRTFGLARPALRYAERLVSHDDALAELAERRAAVYDALVPLAPGRLGRHGELLGSVVDDVDALVDRRLRVRLPLVTWAGVLALATTTALLLAPPAAAVIALTGLAGGSAAWGCGWWAARRHESSYVGARADLASTVLPCITGARQLVLWQREGAAAAEVARVSDRTAAAATASARGNATGRALALVAAGAGLVAVAAAAGTTAALSAPMAALLVLLPLALADVTVPLADAGTLSVRCSAALHRLDALARTPPAVVEPAVPSPLDTPDRRLALERVTTGWDRRPVLHDLSMVLPAGARIGVVGPSGCGKSTLAALMLRFLAPQRGRVLLGGVDAAELGGHALRQRVALVPDDPYLFGSTVRENLRLARPDADDEQITGALATAGLRPWLDALPRGLDTMLGDGHASVSGGERARLGIARALLADPDVLVLDEPTAHLDTGTAQQVTDDLLAASDGRSLLWITHGRVGLDRMDAVASLSGADPLSANAVRREEAGQVLARTGIEPVDEPVHVAPGPRDRRGTDPVPGAREHAAEPDDRREQATALGRVTSVAEAEGGLGQLGERRA